MHTNCKSASIPKSNTDFWLAKLEHNVENDLKHKQQLEQMGWNVITIWECEIEKNLEDVIKTVVNSMNQFIEYSRIDKGNVN